MSPLMELVKPSITRMCVLMTAGGFLLAPQEIDGWRACFVLLGSALAVAGANAFNMWLERGPDGKMARTRRRPLPTGRMRPIVALRVASGLSVAAVLVLAVGTQPLTAFLAALAIVAYAFVYTPLKYVTPAALVIGALPGAMPPLLGWTAATGSLDAAGIVLFAVLFVWQIPHFIAIALYRKEEYARAGVRVLPLVRGDAIAKIHAVAWSMLLVPVSLLLVPLGLGGPVYLGVAVIAGTAFLAWSFTGLDDAAGVRWARRFFLASLLYLPLLVGALMLDRLFFFQPLAG